MSLDGWFHFRTFGTSDSILYVVQCWLIWKNRNKAIFEQSCGRVEKLICAAECMARNIRDACYRTIYPQEHQRKKVVWSPPEQGWTKVNTDDASGKDEDWNAAGSVLRDSNGKWITGFQKFVGKGSALNSELWAILLGLQVAKDRGIDIVILESDCKVGVDLINESLDGAPSTTIIRQIKEATKGFVKVKFQFIIREDNRLANCLAKTCTADATNLHIIDVPSLYIKSLLMKGITCTHHV